MNTTVIKLKLALEIRSSNGPKKKRLEVAEYENTSPQRSAWQLQSQ